MDRQELMESIRAYQPFNEQEKMDKSLILDWIETQDDAFSRDNTVAHMTASAWVVNKDRSRVLMVYHNIYDSWSWLGGHADGETDLLAVAIREVKEDVKQTIKDLTVNPMKISHDAAQPVGNRIAYGNKKVGICTDLGVYNDYTVECLKGMDALLVEANHDVKMLQVGPYPYYLKQRILGERGHLSNENSGKLLCRILHDKLQAIVLGHLSKENNLPELAYEAVRMEITMGENPYRAEDFRMMVADRSNVSPVINIA